MDGNGTFGEQQIIVNFIYVGFSFFVNDIDDDGDMDVITTGHGSIYWFENIDNNESFDIMHNIITSGYSSSIFLTDIDNDGDLDLISANGTKIVWYENIDGNGTFGEQQIIAINLVMSVFAADIDGDGDTDILSASWSEGNIAWYENIDGNGTFGEQQIITTNAAHASSVFATDIDGDGDIDVLSASGVFDKIAWYENTDGNGTFGTQQIITSNADDASYVFAADLDGDGDMDVLSASSNDDKIAWYENTNGNGTFGTQQIITTNADNARSVFASDIDGDGDMDVLSASSFDDKIAWYENTDGNGTFGAQQIITTNVDRANSVIATDIDGDGDMDVFFSSTGVNAKIAWFENLGKTTNKITGTITAEIAGNCDVILSDILVKTGNGTESYTTFSLTNGVYQFFPEIGNFTTEIVSTSLPDYYTASPNLYNDNFTNIGNSVTHNFCLQPNQTANDVTISIVPTSQAIPGFDTAYQIIYKNIGTTQLNGNIILNFDNTKLSLINASETIDNQTSNSLTFN